MNISLENFKNLCDRMQGQKQLVDDFKAELSEHQKKLDEMKDLIVEYLGHHNLTRFSTDNITVTKIDKINVKLEDKFTFFEYLKKNNMFEAMATVNSMTLNAFYKEEMARAISEGKDDFNIPGVKESSMHASLSIRKNK